TKKLDDITSLHDALPTCRRMRPLEDMVETSSAIAEGDLARRVPSSRDPILEVEQLRLALNSMLQQVESAYRTRERSAAQLRRFRSEEHTSELQSRENLIC